MTTISNRLAIEKYVHQLYANGMRELEDSFKHPFHQFIKVKTRGEEISGKVWKVDLMEKEEGVGYQFQLVLGKYMVENSIRHIPLDAIERITPLDVSFPPKHAHDQAHAFGIAYRKAAYRYWFVEITSYANTQFVGRLMRYFSFQFVIEPPNSPNMSMYYSIHEIKIIRRLPYTIESVGSFEKDRRQAIERELPRFPKVLIPLITDYLFGDIPDEIPAVYFNLLKEKYAERMAEESASAMLTNVRTRMTAMKSFWAFFKKR